MFTIYNPDHKLYYFSYLKYQIEYKRSEKEARIFDKQSRAEFMIYYIQATSEERGRPVHKLIVKPFSKMKYALQNTETKRYYATWLFYLIQEIAYARNRESIKLFDTLESANEELARVKELSVKFKKPMHDLKVVLVDPRTVEP